MSNPVKMTSSIGTGETKSMAGADRMSAGTLAAMIACSVQTHIVT